MLQGIMPGRAGKNYEGSRSGKIGGFHEMAKLRKIVKILNVLDIIIVNVQAALETSIEDAENLLGVGDTFDYLDDGFVEFEDLFC